MSTVRILLVDDHPGFLDAATHFLSGIERAQVIGSAGTAGQAMSMIARLHPDLVLLDLLLPQADGISIARAIKSLVGAPRVVIVSLHDTPQYREAAARAGVDGYVSKSEFVSRIPHWIHTLQPEQPAAAP